MDPASFSKLSLADKSPVATNVQKNSSLSGPVLQNQAKQSEVQQDPVQRTRIRGRHKKHEQNSASYSKSLSSVCEIEEDGGVLLNTATKSVLAKVLAPRNATAKPTAVNILATSTNGSSTATKAPIAPEDYSTTTAHQAAKATIKLMKRERSNARRDAKFANVSRPSKSTALDPTAPVYKPMGTVLPLGGSNNLFGQPIQRYTPYEPVRFTSTATYKSLASPNPASPFICVSTPVSNPASTSVSAPVSAATSTPASAPTFSKEPRAVPLADQLPKTALHKRSSKRSYIQGAIREDNVPKPEAAYILQASRNPTRMPLQQSLLLVLDMNGTMVCRQKRSLKFAPRPLLSHFLDYCMTNHSVLVWSSARPENVNRICGAIFTTTQRPQVIAEWGRDTLELSKKDFYEDVQVYKRLDRIWNNESIQMKHPQYAQGGRWSQSNTVLIDDSMNKAAKQPYNHLEIPEFLGPAKPDGDDVLGQVVAYLEEARRWDDVSRFIKLTKFRMDTVQSWDWEKGQRLCR